MSVSSHSSLRGDAAAAMARITPHGRRRLAFVVSTAAPFGLAAALIPLRSHTPNTTVALILAVCVVVVAAVGTRITAAICAISAGIGFDVFHTQPYGSLAITRAADVQTTLLLLAVGLLVGQITARSRHHQALAAETSLDLLRVHGLAEMVAAGDPVDQVIIAAANEIRGLLGLLSCSFTESFAATPGPFIERQGDVSWGSLRWGYSTTGLPGQPITLVVQHQGRPLGRYVLSAEAGTRVSEDQLVAAVSLADQVGAAIAAQGIP